MAYKDDNIKSKKTEDHQKCAEYSVSTPPGNFWTYNSRTKMCSVKKTKGRLGHVGHVVSGNKACGRKTAKKIPSVLTTFQDPKNQCTMAKFQWEV